MPSINLGIATVSFEVNYPTIDGEVDLEIPHGIPKVGGKKFKLDKFSLSLQDPTITIPLNLEFFGGSVTIGLDFSSCEVQVSGKIKLDVIVKKYHWEIGPASIPYMNPLTLAEPSWSVNPVSLDASTLQSLINSAPPQINKSGPPVRNDSATQAELSALLTFAGAGNLIENLTTAANTFTANLQQDMATRPDHPLARALSASAGGALLAFGVSGTGGVGIGGAGACGIFVTTGGDCGYYGSAALDLGFILELSGGACAVVYWPDASENALQCFEGNNAFVSIDGGELVCGSLTFSWPENSDLTILSDAPCGVAVGLGFGVGFPVNFFYGNSHTWVDLNPPNF
jgi:hypothetical protein